MRKGVIIFLLILVNQLPSFAFEFSIGLRESAFEGYKYNFSVVKVIDGRLNKEKPVGKLLWGFSTSAKPVGNDSLGFKMDQFFRTHPASFDTSTKIIVVINQINLRKLGGYSALTGKIEDIEISVSLDYYKVTGNTCALLYKHYCRHRESVKFIGKASKAIDVSFSETVRLSFDNLKNQISKYGFVTAENVVLPEFYNSFTLKPAQVVSDTNIKDGIYFSAKDIYLNRPGLTAEKFLPDTASIGKKPVSLLSPDYLIARAYAVVRFKRIFIFIGDDFYKEAFLSEDGKLFFPDVTQASISDGARGGAVAVSILGSFASMFIPTGNIIDAAAKGVAVSATTSAMQQSIKKSGTTRVTTDVIIDYETGNLIPNKP